MVRRWLVVMLALGMLLGGVFAVPVFAADHVVGGDLLLLRRDPGSSVLTIVLRGPALPVPAPGSADDPSRAALLVTLFGRGSGARASFVAPDGLGRPGWNVRALPRVSFSYANPGAAPDSGAISLASLRAGTALRIRAPSAGLALAAPEGAVAVRVEMGETRVCALFDSTSVRRDQAGRFIARDADASGLDDCDDDSLAGLSCEASLSCGGSCPGDGECGGNRLVNGCTCVSPNQPCGDTTPVCNGECPAGQECSNLGGAITTTCACMPTGSTPCGGVYPSCGDGDCPAGTACITDTFTCCGGVTIQNCACLTGPPPDPCGGCPDGWTCFGPAPGFPAICLPPFCNDGAGAPVCSGTCALAGTECTPIGGVCLCLDPCIGAEPYPTCGGTCSDAGFTCRAVEGQCVCMP